MSDKRVFWLDNLRGFAILLIVLGHTDGISYWLRSAVYAVHIPLFFVISGILHALRQEEEAPLNNQIAKRAVRLFWPYLTFSAAVILYQLFRGNPQGALSAAKYTVLLEGCNTLWFLPTAFFSETAFILLRKRKLPLLACAFPLAAVSAVLSLFLYYVTGCADPLPLGKKYVLLTEAGRICSGTAFVISGYWGWRRFGVRLASGADKHRMRSAALFCVLTAVCVLISRVNGMVDLHYGWQGKYPVLFWLGALSGTAGLAGLFSLADRNCLLTFWGKNSLTIMATHYSFPLFAAAKSLMEISSLQTSALPVLALVMMMETGIAGAVGHFLPFMLKPPEFMRKKQS